MSKVLVTGGCGFIGSHFIDRYLKKNPTHHVVNVDSLAYAGRIENTASFKNNERYEFIHEDICDATAMTKIFGMHEIDTVVHFAAESHVDNSIDNALPFIKTNIGGTYNLLQASKHRVDAGKFKLFLQVSTDEVYGSFPFDSKLSWKENQVLAPKSPYSASKAAAEMLVMSYYNTYDVPTITTRCANNFGARQHEEKLIPVVLKALINKTRIPIYGDGKNVRDWMSVKEHCDAIMFLMNHGTSGEIYNISSRREISNIDLVRQIIEIYSNLKGESSLDNLKLIEYVTDRLGHDERYSIDISKLLALGWKAGGSGFVVNMEEVVQYYSVVFSSPKSNISPIASSSS